MQIKTYDTLDSILSILTEDFEMEILNNLHKSGAIKTYLLKGIFKKELIEINNFILHKKKIIIAADKGMRLFFAYENVDAIKSIICNYFKPDESTLPESFSLDAQTISTYFRDKNLGNDCFLLTTMHDFGGIMIAKEIYLPYES